MAARQSGIQEVRASAVPDLAPARMVNEFAYCPRLDRT